MTRKEKRRLHRQALKKEMRARLIPRLLELGFSSTRTKEGRVAWPGEAERDTDYARRRGDRLDRLTIVWERWGSPYFHIFFTASRADAPSSMGELIAGDVQAARASGFLKVIGVREKWFGRGHSPELAVSLAVRGVEDLNLFLLNGDDSPHLEVRRVGYHSPGPGFNNLTLLWMLPVIVLWPISVPLMLLTKAEPGSRRSKRDPL